MTEIKTWDERINTWPETSDIMDAMQAEINDLREALAYAQESVAYMLEKTGYMDVEVLVDEFVKVKQESKDEIARLEQEKEELEDFLLKRAVALKAERDELNLQYISDFGQLQEQPPVEVRLWDSQWVNVVNHDNCYASWFTVDAVHHAVKMTEQLIAKNVAENNLPPKQKE